MSDGIVFDAELSPTMQKVLKEVPTPAYVIDAARLRRNLEILQQVKMDTGCKILLAQKAFSMFYFYPLIRQYLDGTTASGLYEARLGREEMGGEVHVFSPAYRDDEFLEIVDTANYIVFNSFAQWIKYRKIALDAGCICGLRVNPELSTQDTPIYDPCAPGSRLGIRKKDFQDQEMEGISGIHFHTLCEQGAEPLAETLRAVEENFGECLPRLRWINFGGGHHITKPGYNLSLLKDCIRRMQERYGLTVYLEPGEAVALDSGELAATVLDIVPSDMPIAILDTSAACHMPDVIEMPYRPPLFASGERKEKRYTYRLAGPTCLAGDVIGEYSFDSPLCVGDRLFFQDMAIYSMVKNNTFNGMPLPAIIAVDEDGRWRTVRQFGYENFKNRLS